VSAEQNNAFSICYFGGKHFAAFKNVYGVGSEKIEKWKNGKVGKVGKVENGKVEKWKCRESEKIEKWKSGKVGKWESGKMEKLKVEKWKSGKVEKWKNGKRRIRKKKTEQRDSKNQQPTHTHTPQSLSCLPGSSGCHTQFRLYRM